ncbi:hypothetical protein DFA_09492 [Cavenderia fasciculata]|uniref:Transmembrane protein n=1 Tax=Cavenderia fasciculata TaxID=261658 RepID=F4Q7S3_CACFS|nr:uncharacterized protein DFA_09492 [Cavenderia fasciculata]EGG15823.1 hypothetical protein DFA_09492 [Cavenderia fasciculata]|eukprot:XP_004352148.1 hypothetical protein DFA_09492 [Cavenderia fasciculata]
MIFLIYFQIFSIIRILIHSWLVYIFINISINYVIELIGLFNRSRNNLSIYQRIKNVLSSLFELQNSTLMLNTVMLVSRLICFCLIYPLQMAGYHVLQYPSLYINMIHIGTVAITLVWCDIGAFCTFISLGWLFECFLLVRYERLIRPLVLFICIIISYVFRDTSYYILTPTIFISIQLILFCVILNNKQAPQRNHEIFESKLSTLPKYMVFCVILTLIRRWSMPQLDQRTLNYKIYSDTWAMILEMVHKKVVVPPPPSPVPLPPPEQSDEPMDENGNEILEEDEEDDTLYNQPIISDQPHIMQYAAKNLQRNRKSLL